MLYIYNSTQFNPYHNLALEDYFIKYADKNLNTYILYFWQNANTIVIGRNQDAFCECNIDKLKRYNTYIARRKTGGGAVFHDKNNLNYTFIVPKQIFDKKTSMEIIKNALCNLGFNAEISGRNDILIDNRKCSGNAYLETKNIVLHHGTILIDTKFEIMQELLNVPQEKLQSKGVKSVKSRVVNLRELNKSITAEDIKTSVQNSFLETYTQEYSTIEVDDKLIDKEFFENDLWIYKDRNFAEVKHYTKKFPWGLCQIKIISDNGKKLVKIASDALDYKSVEKAQEILNENKSKNPSDNEIIANICEYYNSILSLQ